MPKKKKELVSVLSPGEKMETKDAIDRDTIGKDDAVVVDKYGKVARVYSPFQGGVDKNGHFKSHIEKAQEFAKARGFTVRSG